jgi:hypothetical protein
MDRSLQHRYLGTDGAAVRAPAYSGTGGPPWAVIYLVALFQDAAGNSVRRVLMTFLDARR